MPIDKTESAGLPFPPDTLKFRKYFWIFLGVVLVSRLMLWGTIKDNPGVFLEHDSPSYLGPADALFQEGRYDTQAGSNTPETLRTPGYPAWLAWVYLLFGKSADVLIFSQIALFLGTLVLLYFLAESMFGSRTALPAVIFLALDPSSLSYTFKILTETLATFIVLGLAWFIFKFFESARRNVFGFLCGLCLALATLVRPTFYYFLPVLLIVFAVFLVRGKVEKKKIVAALLITALPVVLLVGGWQWRNLEKAGVFQITTIRGWVLYLGKGSQIYEDLHHVGWLEAEAALNRKLIQKYPDWPSLSWEQKDAIFVAEGKKLIWEHPWLAVKGQLRHMAYFFFAPGTTSSFFRMFDPGFKIENFKWFNKWNYFRTLLTDHPVFLAGLILGAAYLAGVYGFLAAWAVSTWRSQESMPWKGTHLAILLLVLYIAALSSVGSGIDRYRVVVMPLLCLYAGAGGLMFFYGFKALRLKKIRQADPSEPRDSSETLDPEGGPGAL